MIKSVEDRVTTIKRELGHIDFAEVVAAMKDGFKKVFDVELVEGQLSREERRLASKLKKDKCSTADWTLRDKNNSTSMRGLVFCIRIK